jgi:hypothetical protein
MRSTFAILILASCTSSSPPRPMSAAEHYAEARAHDRDADTEETRATAERSSAAPDVVCGNRTLSDQSTSGGVVITHMVPCWTKSSPRDAHIHRATKLRREARVHRTIAASLIKTEREACDAIAPSQRDHTPSWHREDIARVEPIRDDGAVVGARVVFRKVEGLSTAWLRAAYACHHAQAAVEGYDPAFMPYCPSALASTTIDVVERDDGLAVTFRANRPEVGAAVWGRASALVTAEP